MASILGLDTLNPATLLSGRYKQEEIPDLTGKVALVTGGSAGIGYHDALGLARAGAKVLTLSTTPEHGRQAEEEMNQFLKENVPGGKGSVKWYQADLGDLKATDAIAKKIAEQEERLDILINNAGIGQVPYALTKDGIENHYGVNNLSYYVLTLRLLPLMQKTAESSTEPTVRIVMQSSELHRAANSDTKFASMEEIQEKRDPTIAYGRSKLGMILFAKQLAKRKLSGTSSRNKILITSCHPGTVDTDLQTAWTQSYGVLGQVIEPLSRLMGKSAPEGAEASLWLATSPEIGTNNFDEFQGGYFSEAKGKPDTESNLAKDETVAQNFWNLCAAQAKKILGEDLQ